MGRKTSQNKSYYHYYIETEEGNGSKSTEYFLTQTDIATKFDISKSTIVNKINNPYITLRYERYNNCQFTIHRCCIPYYHQREVNKYELDIIRNKLYN